MIARRSDKRSPKSKERVLTVGELGPYKVTISLEEDGGASMTVVTCFDSANAAIGWLKESLSEMGREHILQLLRLHDACGLSDEATQSGST